MQNQLQDYKELIKGDYLEKEKYKWDLINEFKGRPNLEVDDLAAELKAIKYGNLCYKYAIAVLVDIANQFPAELKQILSDLFDENKDLNDRIKNYRASCKALYDPIKPRPTDGDYQDERTAASLLTVRYPEKYTFYKSSFYKNLCEYLGVKKAKAGKKYTHYLELLKNIKSENPEILEEINEIVKSKLPENYTVQNDLLILQDFVYHAFESNVKEAASVTKPNQKIWMYAPGENAKHWDEFYEQGVMGLGWDELGDLDDYESKEEIVSKLQELHDTTGSKKNDATANFDFKENIEIGDLVIAKKGRSEYLGYGVVTSEYYYNHEKDYFQKSRKVNWLKKGSWIDKDKNIVLKTLTDITIYEDYVHYLKNLLGIDTSDTTSKKHSKKMKQPLNQILYGPPGTGKTFNTVNKSLEIIGYDFQNKDRKSIVEDFNRFVAEGKIVFTTFHQSMSYEDFIEGIKPVTIDGDVTYEVQDGVFKNICTEAKFEYVNQQEDSVAKSFSEFSEAYQSMVDKWEELNEQGKNYIVQSKNRSDIEVVGLTPNGHFITSTIEGERNYTVSEPRLTKLHMALGDLNELKNINREFREIIGGSNATNYWAVLNEIRTNFMNKNDRAELKDFSLNQKKELFSNAKDVDYSIEANNRVLIIDEINRGNVSSIFGELITLLEPDKRLGAKNELSVKLPYSRETFGVPQNLYVIGTMNTADRSVEALDTALRRRFSFQEVMPDTAILSEDKIVGVEDEEISTQRILEVINQRIEMLIDRDHAIGHAYFINVQNVEQLQDVFQDKIIPLLQEYFFGDYAKIGLVLGKGFVRSIETDASVFANFEYERVDEFNYERFELIPSEKIDFIEALQNLLNLK